MFGHTRKLCAETLAETRMIRLRLDELTGRTGAPPRTRAEFYNDVDAAVDTPNQKIGCTVVSRVLHVAFAKLRALPEPQRSAMLQELLR